MILKRVCTRTAVLVVFFITWGVHGAGLEEWRKKQVVEVEEPGLVRVILPSSTIDSSCSGLEDLRIIDANGITVPYLVVYPQKQTPAFLPIKRFNSTIEDGKTVLIIETGQKQTVDMVTLETPSSYFIKSVRVEGSKNGRNWRRIVDGTPIYQHGRCAVDLNIDIPEDVWPWLKLTIDDWRSMPVPFVGANVHSKEPKKESLSRIPVEMVSVEQGDSETRINLDFGAANIFVSELFLKTDEPLFLREVSLVAKEMTEEGLKERIIAEDIVFKVETGDGATSSSLSVRVEQGIPSRILALVIRNKDNPPISIKAVTAVSRPIQIIFSAKKAGSYSLFTGNSACAKPEYDLEALSKKIEEAPASRCLFGPISDNPDFVEPEALRNVDLRGVSIDKSSWKYSKEVGVEKDGVYELELDEEVLSHAKRDLSDLRLVQADKQVFYLIDRTSMSRFSEPKVSSVKVPERPNMSRWSVKARYTALPVSKLVCNARSKLFERHVRAFEENEIRGNTRTRELGEALWSKNPKSESNRVEMDISSNPTGDSFFIETDNGDNPPLELEQCKLLFPIVRLIFKREGKEPIVLYYGNDKASMPRYDLRLVGNQLLSAKRTEAKAGKEELVNAESEKDRLELNGVMRVLFWVILAIVVLALLIIIIKVVPKSETP